MSTNQSDFEDRLNELAGTIPLHRIGNAWEVKPPEEVKFKEADMQEAGMIPQEALAAAVKAMAPVVKELEATLLAQAALEAAAPFLRAQVLEELLTPEALERARKVVEDELIDWRDNGRFVLRRNGLMIRNRDGSGSEIIRFGFEDGMRIAIEDRICAATERGDDASKD